MTGKYLLTGATGFIGNALLQKQIASVLLGRSCPPDFTGKFFNKELSATADYSGCFLGIDSIVHCAARVHVMNEQAYEPLQAFREVNVAGTLNLARQAVEAGVKRFIFVSSIKVNGEGTQESIPFTTNDQPAPEDPYGISKHEAEAGLLEMAKETELDVVIIRPSLVYGAGVKGNFLNLLKLAKSGVPLPFGSIHNTRSMVYLDNLVDLIITCIDHQNAPGKVFLASDGDDVSLSRLIRLIRGAMGRPALLLPVPVILFKLIGKLTGKAAVINRLVGDLQVDSSDARLCLDWQSPYSVEYGIKATVDDFMQRTEFESNK
jgi:UDP-glucose 4-epimerase